MRRLVSTSGFRVSAQNPGSNAQRARIAAFSPLMTKWYGSIYPGKTMTVFDLVMAVYPMLLDEACFFLAADFDKA